MMRQNLLSAHAQCCAARPALRIAASTNQNSSHASSDRNQYPDLSRRRIFELCGGLIATIAADTCPAMAEEEMAVPSAPTDQVRHASCCHEHF